MRTAQQNRERRSWRRAWATIERNLRGDEVAERLMSNQRDPLAIAIGTVGLVAQVGMWIWWGGKIDQRVSTLEGRQQQAETLEREKVNVDALQTTQITVLQTKLDNIKESVDRIDRKIPERTR